MRKFLSAGLFLFCLMGVSQKGFSQQDTLKVMFYNLLNYPSAGTTPDREDTLRKILQYIQPDILLVCELDNSTGANLILNQSLNVWGQTQYQQANFVTNQSGSDNNQNLLYYNSDKISLGSQITLTTDLRDINGYHIFFNDSNLAITGDTTWLDLYVTHLKAGSSSSDQTRREQEVQVLIDHMSTYTQQPTAIFAGDFNIQSSSETSFQNLLTTGTWTWNDPINSPGNWNNNAAFSGIHTQSTRTAQFNGGATGGMDDRFDFILTTADILNGTARVQYLTGSYEAVGQDGQRLNQELISAPANTSAPDSVISAMYYMSDHLPVIMDIVVTLPQPTAAADPLGHRSHFWCVNPVQDDIILNFEQNYTSAHELKLVDLYGRTVAGATISVDAGVSRHALEAGHLPAGIYYLMSEDMKTHQSQTVKIVIRP